MWRKGSEVGPGAWVPRDPGIFSLFLRRSPCDHTNTCYMNGYTHISSVSQGKGPREVQGLVQDHTANESKSWYSYLRFRITGWHSDPCGLNSLDLF